MTMNISDRQLIRQYAEASDQHAFEQLVKRYIDLAYSAARSCLGWEDLARDACQLTFVELSRKAAHIKDPAKLGSWIYSTTRNLSRKIQRTEVRRQQREQRYMDHQLTQTAPKPDWSHLVPEIHAALDQLKAADREAIILRYFQGKSLVEIGEILGVSADAVRMRVKRALEQLNAGLCKKGISSTTAALAAALPTHAALSAPPELAASISTTVLAAAGTTISVTTLTGIGITIMKAKILIISAVAATTIVGGSVYLAKQSNKELPNLATEKNAASTEPSEQTVADSGMTAAPTNNPSESVATENPKPNATKRGQRELLATMAKNPTINKAREAAQRGAIESMYEDFIDYLKLSPEESEFFVDLLMSRQMGLLNLMSAGDIPSEKREAMTEQLLVTDSIFRKQMEQFLNNSDDFDEWIYFEKTIGERMMLSQMDQDLYGTEAALSDESYKSVLEMMYVEKSKIYSDDFYDPTNMDYSPERFSKEKLLAYADETTQLNKEILTKAEQMLSEQQFASFSLSLKNTTQFQLLQLRQLARLIGGWE